jgi:hypothetical protein
MKNTSGPSKGGPFVAIPRKREVAITKTIQPVQNSVQNRPATKDSKKNHFIKLPPYSGSVNEG